MNRSTPLKSLRPGNVRINNSNISMTPRPETVGPESVLQPWHTIQVTVERFFTDVNGTILPIADAGLVASGMVQNYPAFLLGAMDWNGGYKVGLNICPPIGTIKPLQVFTNGAPLTSHNICTPYSPFNTIQARLTIGDIVHVFCDNIAAPNYFCFMVYKNNVASMASILANLVSLQNDRRLMKLFCRNVNFICDNFRLQLSEQWNYYNVDNIGRYKNNQISYSMFDTPYNVAPDVLTFETRFDVDQFAGIATYMVPAISAMTFAFNLIKIQ